MPVPASRVAAGEEHERAPRRGGTRAGEAVAGGGGPAVAPGRTHQALTGLAAVVAGVLAFFPADRANEGPRVLAAALTMFAVGLALVRPLWAWRVLIVVVGCADQLYGIHARFGWPWTEGFAVAAIPVLVAVGRTHRPGVLAWVWLISTGVGALLANVRGELVAISVLLAVPLAFGWLVSRLRGAERDLEAESTRRAVLEERARIARELHDVVAHHMSVLAMRADSARYRFPGLDEGLREEFQSIQDTARNGMTEMLARRPSPSPEPSRSGSWWNASARQAPTCGSSCAAIVAGCLRASGCRRTGSSGKGSATRSGTHPAHRSRCWCRSVRDSCGSSCRTPVPSRALRRTRRAGRSTGCSGCENARRSAVRFPRDAWTAAGSPSP
ncbi:Histidine kinase [Amycolatopsis rubida]|uniref:histidine kinase n=1 Tax=Amycolatopsis rubida TaxID=112413 RepID=A0A1I5PM43_9PSEU|nr:histidine kinase [Amycolatopsis rubida]SFP35124.1 Histidine kinase [Amycolatopsis rubida]